MPTATNRQTCPTRLAAGQLGGRQTDVLSEGATRATWLGALLQATAQCTMHTILFETRVQAQFNCNCRNPAQQNVGAGPDFMVVIVLTVHRFENKMEPTNPNANTFKKLHMSK